MLGILPTCSNGIFRALVVLGAVARAFIGLHQQHTGSLEVRKLSCCPGVCLQQQNGTYRALFGGWGAGLIAREDIAHSSYGVFRGLRIWEAVAWESAYSTNRIFIGLLDVWELLLGSSSAYTSTGIFRA